MFLNKIRKISPLSVFFLTTSLFSLAQSPITFPGGQTLPAASTGIISAKIEDDGSFYLRGQVLQVELHYDLSGLTLKDIFIDESCTSIEKVVIYKTTNDSTGFGIFMSDTITTSLINQVHFIFSSNNTPGYTEIGIAALISDKDKFPVEPIREEDGTDETKTTIFVQPHPSYPIVFTDPALKAAIQQLVTPSQSFQPEITYSMIEHITYLDLRGMGLTSLNGLELFNNLEYLDVRSNKLTDVKALMRHGFFGMRSHHFLDLGKNQLGLEDRADLCSLLRRPLDQIEVMPQSGIPSQTFSCQ